MRSNYERLERRRRLAYDTSLSTAPGVEMKMRRAASCPGSISAGWARAPKVAGLHHGACENHGEPGHAPTARRGEGWLRIVTACFASDEDAAVRFERIKAALTGLAKGGQHCIEQGRRRAGRVSNRKERKEDH